MPTAMMVAIMAVVLALPLGAQELTRPDRPSAVGQRAQHRSLVKPLEVIGSEVRDSQGETLGEVLDVVTDKTWMAYAVISVGRFLDLTEKQVALPMERVHPDPAGHVVVHMTKKELQGLPVFDEEQYLPMARD